MQTRGWLLKCPACPSHQSAAFPDSTWKVKAAQIRRKMAEAIGGWGKVTFCGCRPEGGVGPTVNLEEEFERLACSSSQYSTSPKMWLLSHACFPWGVVRIAERKLGQNCLGLSLHTSLTPRLDFLLSLEKQFPAQMFPSTPTRPGFLPWAPLKEKEGRGQVHSSTVFLRFLCLLCSGFHPAGPCCIA